MATRLIHQIAIVGFGEVGGIFANDLAKQGIKVSVFDILFASSSHRRHMLAKSENCGVIAAENLGDCLRHADLVISAVTASSALEVATEAGRLLRSGQIFLDLNSISPDTKRRLASRIEPSKAQFVEAAVMAGVPTPRLKVPMLLGGPHAVEAAERLQAIGMNATALSDQIGVASAVKMCRSVIMKGLEALAVESLFAARQYGAEDAVLQSLTATFPGLGWTDQLPDYLIGRVAQHGRRRAVEMREVAQALEAVGIEPTMALATAKRQERLVIQMEEKNLRFDEKNSFSWRSLAEAIGADTGLDLPRQLRNES
jgi:3-hydroxyisobutyrate dehydrogenase-like beta-hydroxyacid dehydrogenase